MADMKRFILLVMLCLPTMAMAESPTFKELVSKYSTMQHCTTIELSKSMLESMGADSDIDSLTAVSVESGELIEGFRRDVDVVTKDLSMLLSVNNDGDAIKIYGREEAGSIVEVMVLTISDAEGVLIQIKGDDISLSEATSLISIE